jgi:hypothetical protein
MWIFVGVVVWLANGIKTELSGLVGSGVTEGGRWDRRFNAPNALSTGRLTG